MKITYVRSWGGGGYKGGCHLLKRGEFSGGYNTCIYIYHDYSTTPSIHYRYMLICCSHEPPATAQIKHIVHFNFHTFHTMYILDLVGWGNQLKRYIPIQARLAIVYNSYGFYLCAFPYTGWESFWGDKILHKDVSHTMTSTWHQSVSWELLGHSDELRHGTCHFYTISTQVFQKSIVCMEI